MSKTTIHQSSPKQELWDELKAVRAENEEFRRRFTDLHEQIERQKRISDQDSITLLQYQLNVIRTVVSFTLIAPSKNVLPKP